MKYTFGIVCLAWSVEDVLHLMDLTQHTLWSAVFYGILGIGLLARHYDEKQGGV